MANLTIADRIVRHFDDFEHRWRAQFGRRKAEYGTRGLTGSSPMIKSGFAIFETELNEMLERLLGEIANVIRHRRGAWHDAHTQVRDYLGEQYPDITGRIGQELGTRGDFDWDQWQYYGVDVSKSAIDRINAHESGFTSPHGDPFPVRHPMRYAILCGIFGVAGGVGGALLEDVARTAIFGEEPVVQSQSPGTQSAPTDLAPEPASTPAGTATPAA